VATTKASPIYIDRGGENLPAHVLALDEKRDFRSSSKAEPFALHGKQKSLRGTAVVCDRTCHGLAPTPPRDLRELALDLGRIRRKVMDGALPDSLTSRS
jgi:hypothetical protein